MNRSTIALVAANLLVACARHREATPLASAPVHEPAQDGPAPVAYSFRSDIPYCLDAVGKETVTDANLLLGVVELKTRRITAACGCPSKWLLWRSVTAKDGIETEFASGTLLAAEPQDKPREARVVLLGDRSHAPGESLLVHVGCAPAP